MSNSILNLALDLDGKAVAGQAAFANGLLWVHLDGETYTYEVPEGNRTRTGGRKAKAVNPGEVAAPMPGKIVKILVKPGDSVQAQQVLLVMEAMKMEYTLKAQANGKVTEVKTEPGKQVSLGQILIQLETGNP